MLFGVILKQKWLDICKNPVTGVQHISRIFKLIVITYSKQVLPSDHLAILYTAIRLFCTIVTSMCDIGLGRIHRFFGGVSRE